MNFVTEFLMIALGLMVFVAGLTFGIDREMARREYEHYKSSQQEQIVGCIWEYNCRYYNDLLDGKND